MSARIATVCAIATVAIAGGTATLLTGTGSVEAAAKCQGRAFPWGGQCWSPSEGRAFAGWLSRHGTSARKFKANYPQLARIFKRPWPPETTWAALEHDFHKALRHAAARFDTSYSWLHNCVHSEGGHGPRWVTGSAGEQGPAQFLPSTFAWMARSAFQARGHPPLRYRDVYSNVGQTWTMAWAFSAGLSYHWFGAGC